MKKLLLIALMSVGFSHLQAQTKFGGQLDYSTSSVASFGIGANAEIFINDNMSIAPSFVYYFPKESVSGVTQTYWAINGDFHYYFTDDSPKFYGIGGLSFFNSSASVSGYGGSASTFGINLGAGANFGAPFAEIKYNSPMAALVITAGFRFGGK